ncbi:MAG: aspartate--tRNA ligase, partial [Thermoleophilia bacterium]|nr:aspartate--tRNA ligase [Thermoleophilia bacterium]
LGVGVGGARATDQVNPNLPTGSVEIQVTTLRIVSRSTPLPFQLDEDNVDETLRLRYRWLDLRRDKLQRNIGLRGQMVGIIRRQMEAAGYLDIQTPILYKSTPEGARDFVVPSRLHKGSFFALPQSPQLLKQLLMIAGFDRYYQIAVCFRDEDLRADRVQEITQLDMETAFPDRDAMFLLMEETFAAVWHECLGIEIPRPFPHMTYAEADRRYGSDKPDTRFALEIEDATEATRGSEFGVFAGADAVRFLRVPRVFSRSEVATLEERAEELGAKGLAYVIRDEAGELRSPIAKFLSDAEIEALAPAAGETLLFAADTRAMTSRVLGALRLQLGADLGLIDEDAFTFLWVTDFPMFEFNEDEARWTAVHHPFTRPTDDWLETFADDPANALAYAYDLIVNGNELGGGSFRIHEPDVQASVFDLLAMSPEDQRSKFGFLLDALAMGAPPHGGIALGIDRMTMVLAGEANLRDVIAFPKNQAGLDPMSGAPSAITDLQLAELGLRVVEAPQTPGAGGACRGGTAAARARGRGAARRCDRARSDRAAKRRCGRDAHADRSRCRRWWLVREPRGVPRAGRRRRAHVLRFDPDRQLLRRRAPGAAVWREAADSLRRPDGADGSDRQQAHERRSPVRTDRATRSRDRTGRHPGDRLAFRRAAAGIATPGQRELSRLTHFL